MSGFPTPQEIKKKLPLEKEAAQFILDAREKAKSIVEKKSFFALVVGPCSIHDIESTLEYAEKLKKLHLKKIKLFMRLYFEKPRTKGGWKGFVYDPFLDCSNQIEKGILLTRELLLKLTRLKIAIATEFLDPLFAPYFSDLISWGFIGSRTSSSQIHRQLASEFNFPIGFKNSPDGTVGMAQASIEAAKEPHTYLKISDDGSISAYTSSGNTYAHLVLRGSLTEANYHLAAKIALPLMIDCSHGNSQKKPKNQMEAFKFAISQKNVFGAMVESHLNEGSQPFSSTPKYGISMTDPCLGFEETESLILFGDQYLSSLSRSDVSNVQLPLPI